MSNDNARDAYVKLFIDKSFDAAKKCYQDDREACVNMAPRFQPIKPDRTAIEVKLAKQFAFLVGRYDVGPDDVLEAAKRFAIDHPNETPRIEVIGSILAGLVAQQ